MTVNKQQKAKKITIEQLFICTTIKLQSWGDFFKLHKEQRNEGGSEKNMRSGEPVQTS